MLIRTLNILEFITHPELLNDQTLSVPQQTFLKGTYGLPLNSEERTIYQRATGRTEYVPAEQKEATLIGGRRGGKDSKIAAPIALYESFRDHHLSRGDRGNVMLIAPAKYQAQIAMRYIRTYLRSSPVLRNYIVRERRDEIELTNGISIACYPCSYVAVRGLSIVCAICDELAFWQHEQTDANPEDEVLSALRPAMATFPTAKLIKISTPFRKEGILWREFQQRAELDHLVWQMPSPEMNPTLLPSILEQERKHDEEKFRREFLAEFTDQINAWVTPDVLEPCIVRGRTELPRVEKATYAVAIDPAFRRDDFALAILHRNADGTIVVDRASRWAGTKKAPLPYEWVCQEIARIVKQYGINRVLGDQYCAAVIKQHFHKLGIHYNEYTFGAHTRGEIFGNLKHLLVQRRIELLDDPTLLRQLRVLEERKAPNGRVDIEPSHGLKDDLAVAVALAALELSRRPPKREPIVEVIPVAPTYQSSIAMPRQESSFSRSRHLERGWIRIGG
jgi:phage terminase large subunit-like protein